jgi:hypothetical protein
MGQRQHRLRAMQRALVLSGGGAKGSWQVGACKHLIGERGVWFDIISGVSVGAVNGTTLAHARDLNGLQTHLERLRSVWFAMRSSDNVYRRRRFGALGMALGRWRSLYDITPLREEILGREIDPEQVATSSVLLKIGYMDLRSWRYRTAANGHPALRDAVLASCAMPFLFPPIPLDSGQELGVDACFGRFAPLGDALHALAELPPDNEPAEAWVLMPRSLGKMAAARMVRKWLHSAFPSVQLRSNDTMVGQVDGSQTIDTFWISGSILCRNSDVRLRVMHPARDLAGSFLDFHPVNIRRWYEDGLRTARGVADGGNGANHNLG